MSEFVIVSISYVLLWDWFVVHFTPSQIRVIAGDESPTGHIIADVAFTCVWRDCYVDTVGRYLGYGDTAGNW